MYDKQSGYRRFLLPVVCLFLLLAAGCGAKNEENLTNQYSQADKQEIQEASDQEDKSEPANMEQDGRNFTIAGFDEQGEKVDSLYQKSVLLEYDFFMPELSLSDEEAAERIESWYEKEREAFGQELAKRTLQADSDCLLRAAEEEQGGWGVAGCYSVRYASYENENNVSFLGEKYQYYSGGAHGTTAYTGVTFDRQTGEMLTLDDFLGGQEKGRLLLAEYLIEQLNEEELYLWKDYAETIAYKLVFDPQFYVEGDTLVFLFDEYDLASYAQGPFFLEVPMEAAEDLKSVVADQSAVERMADRIKNPEEINGYMVEVWAEEAVNMDLDGDGKKEEILFSAKASDQDTMAAAAEASLWIDGKKLTLAADESIVGECVEVVDIDSEDGKYELAVCAAEPDGNPVTAFFRYAHGEIQEIGRIGCILDRAHRNSWNTYLTGDGTIHGERILPILEPRSVAARWELDAETDRLLLYESERYDFFSDDWLEPSADMEGRTMHPYKLTGSVLVYEEPDRTSASKVLSGEVAELIQFTATDGKNWVEAEFLIDESLSCGWIYVKDWYDIEVKENEFESCSKVIENLQTAD